MQEENKTDINNRDNNSKTNIKRHKLVLLPKRRIGDRKDGRKLRSLEPMNVVIPFIMKERNDASNLFQDSVELSEIEKYVHKKRAEGLTGFSAMHVLVAAYVRACSQKPGINRFLSGQRVFARPNVQVNMEIKKELTLNAPATMMKFIFDLNSTATDIYTQMNSMITDYKQAADVPSSFDKIAKLLGGLPRFIFRFTVFLLRTLDYFGLLPTVFLYASPFHGSLVITSMASLGIPPIYHHLYNFGNVPTFISFSTTRHEYKLDKNGNISNHHFLDLYFTTDERICDGHYYASAYHEIKKYLKNPFILDTKPSNIVADIE